MVITASLPEQPDLEVVISRPPQVHEFISCRDHQLDYVTSQVRCLHTRVMRSHMRCFYLRRHNDLTHQLSGHVKTLQLDYQVVLSSDRQSYCDQKDSWACVVLHSTQHYSGLIRCRVLNEEALIV